MTDSTGRAPMTADDPFIESVSMENDPQQCFAGDRGTLDPEVRRVLVRLLKRRFLLMERNRDDWAVLMENQQTIESRLHDLFIRLVVDPERGVAYKQQIRSDEFGVPILLRDDPYSAPETLVLVYLRTIYQRESTSGESSARVDVEDVEQTVLTYFPETDGDIAKRQRTIRRALERLRNEGLIEEESEGRYLISPLIEIVLSANRLRELDNWLRNQTRSEIRLDEDETGPDEDLTDIGRDDDANRPSSDDPSQEGSIA